MFGLIKIIHNSTKFIHMKGIEAALLCLTSLITGFWTLFHFLEIIREDIATGHNFINLAETFMSKERYKLRNIYRSMTSSEEVEVLDLWDVGEDAGDILIPESYLQNLVDSKES